MNDSARQLGEYMRALAKRRDGRTLGRRPRWSAQHAGAFTEQARRASRNGRRRL